MKTNRLLTVVMAILMLATVSCEQNEKIESKEKTNDSVALWPIIIENKWGYIDVTGEIVIKPQFGVAYYFCEGLAAVSDYETGKWGFIDKTGNIVIAPQFDRVEVFSEGLARVGIGDIMSFFDKTGIWGYIDKTGKIVWQKSGLAEAIENAQAEITKEEEQQKPKQAIQIHVVE